MKLYIKLWSYETGSVKSSSNKGKWEKMGGNAGKSNHEQIRVNNLRNLRNLNENASGIRLNG